MSEFMIDFDQTQSCVNRMSEVKDSISACQRVLAEIGISAVLKDSMPLLVPNIIATEMSLAKKKNEIEELSTALNRIIIRFKLAEQNISGEQLVSIEDLFEYIIGGGDGAGGSGYDIGFSTGDFWDILTGANPLGGLISTFGGMFTGDWGQSISGYLSVIGRLAENAFATDPAGVLEHFLGLNPDGFVAALADAAASGTWSEAFLSGIRNQFWFSSANTVGENINVGCTWLASIATNAFDNYEEFGTIANGRFWGELGIETVVDVGLGTLATAGVAAGAVALGITSAPALAIGAVAAGVCWGANEFCKWVTGGRDIGEVVADFVIDDIPAAASWAWDKACEGAEWVGDRLSDVGDAISDIGSSIADGWNSFVDWAF